MCKDRKQLDKLENPTLSVQKNYILINGVTSFSHSKINLTLNPNQTNLKHFCIRRKNFGPFLQPYFKLNDSGLYAYR
jgi:hypothetical protein